MRQKGRTKTVMAIMMVLILGAAGSALAYRDWEGAGRGGWDCPREGYGMRRGGGPGQGDWECPGGGYGMRRDGGPGRGYGMGNLSQEDFEKMNQLRQKFFEETGTLRSDLRSKALALNSEMAKETPDLNTVKNLQKELSALEAQMDQMRIEHQLEMRQLNPNAGRGYGMGYGPKGGRGGYGDGSGTAQYGGGIRASGASSTKT